MSTDLSIIIPAFNRLWALPRAIEQCRASNVKKQIIVVDDGSTDNTDKWLNTQKDLTIIKGQGWGKPFAVNMAMRIACGKYVKFLDSDDFYPDATIDEQVAVAEATGADIVVAGYMEVHEVQGKATYIEKPWVKCDDFISQQLGECDSSHYSAFTFKKSFIEDIPHRSFFASPQFATRDDRCFMLEVALKEPKIAYAKQLGLCHLHHARGRLQHTCGSFTFAANLNLYLIYRRILNILDGSNRLTNRRKQAALKILWPLAHRICYTDYNLGCKVAKWIFELNPKYEVPERGVLGLLYKHLGFNLTERMLALRRLLNIYDKTSGVFGLF